MGAPSGWQLLGSAQFVLRRAAVGSWLCGARLKVVGQGRQGQELTAQGLAECFETPKAQRI